MSMDLSQISYDCVIPSTILFNPNLEDGCVKLYAVVRGLSRWSKDHMEPFCFASNRYLAEVLKLSQSTIKRYLASLESEGYLEVETDTDVFPPQRKIYLSDNFKKFLHRSKNELGGSSNLSPLLEEYPISREVLSPNSQKKGDWGKQDEGTKTSFSDTDFNTQDIQNWRKDFPAVNVDKEIEKFKVWARDNPREDYRQSMISWLTRVQTTHTTPAPEICQPKEVPPEEIETNRVLALGWEKEYGSLGGIHYGINAASSSITFILPAGGFEVSYDMPSHEFHKRCVAPLKRVRHPKFLGDS